MNKNMKNNSIKNIKSLKGYNYNESYIEANRLPEERLKSANIELVALNEVFVKYPDWEDYYVSNYGRAISTKFGRVKLLVASRNNSDRYCYYKFSKPRTYEGNKVKEPQVLPLTAQRAVADIFCPNFFEEVEHNNLQAHHLDKNEANNYYENLILLPKKLHEVMDGVRKLALFKDETFREYTPIEIVEQTGLTLEELLLAVKNDKVYSDTDKKYTIYEVKGFYIGVQFFEKKNKKKLKRKKKK